MKSLVEQTAEREGLPTVRLTRHDLLSVLTGSPMMCSDERGNRVAVRLYRPDEFVEAHRAACATYGQTPSVTLAKAHELVDPVPSSLIWGRS